MLKSDTLSFGIPFPNMKNSIVLIAFAFLLIGNIGRAQDTSKVKTGAWFEAGLGLGGMSIIDDGGAFFSNLAFKVDYEKHLFELRYIHGDEAKIFGEYEDKMNEGALLYGRQFKTDNSRVFASAGLAALGGKDKIFSGGDREFEQYFKLGFAIEAGVDFLLSENLGIGLTFLADINGKNSFAGVTAKLMLGELK